MSTVNNSYSGEKPSLDHMKKYLEAKMEQPAKEGIYFAFFGGVDSSLLLRTAADAIVRTGRDVYTVTSGGRLHLSCDLEIARCAAGELGGIHGIITVDELEQEAAKNNPVNHCYLYRRHLLSKLVELAQIRGIRYTLDDANEDDMHVYRPEVQALKELGIVSPLAKLRIAKAQVKVPALEYGILVVSRPSIPCMTTHLPYGTVLGYEALGKIGTGEAYVRAMVPGNVRLRPHGDIVRLGLDPEAFDVFMKCQKGIVSRLKEMGFMYITLDAEGFRSRNMDTGLTGPS